MNLQEKANVHNKFEFTVVDAKTGKEKQKAVAYNTILDQWFNARVVNAYPSYYNGASRTYDVLQYITFGTGTGTILPTRTALFTYLNRKTATTLQTVYGYPTSYVQKQIKLEANEYVGQTITEVGFEFYCSQFWSSDSRYYLMTHALLQDSEGNQIAINKTDTDVVYITATFYCSHTPAGFGANAVYPAADKNYLARWVLTGGFDTTVRFSRYNLEYSSDMLSYSSGGKQIRTGEKNMDLSTATGSLATGKMDLPMLTFLDSECNNRLIKHLGVAGIGAITFPNHDLFPPYLVERIPIGTGDGIVSEFSIKAPIIMSGSGTVYVNNVAKVRDVDYTIDYENNCGDWYENYHTAGLTCKSPGVTFGDLASKTPNASYDYRDPLSWWNCYDRTIYPSSCTISDVNPIKIDFGTPKPCNTLKFDILTVPAAKIDNLKIQYSANGTDWTDVSGLSRTGQVWKFTEVLARYWRTFLSGEGNATVVVTSSGMTDSPITLSVAVASSDTANIVADKIKIALENNANISALFDASVSGADVVLTAKTQLANVSSLNIALSNGTCSGLTQVTTSTNTTAGVAPVKQQENISVAGSVGTSGNATVVVTAAGMANSPITLSVPVTSGNSAATVANKVNTALGQNSDITDFFTISAANGNYVRLTAKTAAANDPTLNISIANDTCTGLTAIPTSTVDAAGNAGTRQVETLTVAGSVSYNWTYSLYYQSFPTRDGQSFGSTFFLGKTVLGLKFTTPPPAGAAIDATYSLEYPFKTANNLLRFTYSIVLQRG